MCKLIPYKTNITSEELEHLTITRKEDIKILNDLGLSKKEINSIFVFYRRPIIYNNILTPVKLACFNLISKNNCKLSDYKYFLNPISRKDSYTIKTKEFGIINKLGLVNQSQNYPYLILVKDIYSINLSVELSYNQERKLILLT